MTILLNRVKEFVATLLWKTLLPTSFLREKEDFCDVVYRWSHLAPIVVKLGFLKGLGFFTVKIKFSNVENHLLLEVVPLLNIFFFCLFLSLPPLVSHNFWVTSIPAICSTDIRVKKITQLNFSVTWGRILRTFLTEFKFCIVWPKECLPQNLNEVQRIEKKNNNKNCNFFNRKNWLLLSFNYGVNRPLNKSKSRMEGGDDAGPG